MNLPVELQAQWGIGDTIMHRAAVRELMKTRDVYLRTHMPALFVDLIADGLKISSGKPDPRPTVLRSTTPIPITPAPHGTERRPIRYSHVGAHSILATGSTIASQFASIGLAMPAQPDIRFKDIPGEWLDKARRLIKTRPVMVARPLVVNGYFQQPRRNPDPDAYVAAYESIRRDFFTIGVANVVNDKRAGPHMAFDLPLLDGQLDLETLVGLFAEADLVFTPMCFAPWLAQATETPVVTMFGRSEGARTSIAATAGFSPMLAIEASDKPDQTIPRVREFVGVRSAAVDCRLALPDVTLVCVETQVHELARRAIKDATDKVRFGDVLVYTDKPDAIPNPEAHYITVPNWPDKIAAGAFYYSEAAHAIRTSHALLMEWDAGIRDVGMWDPAFLEYDYIGAPWLPRYCKVPGMSVGNGGFALVSKRLADYIFVNKDRLPITTDVDIAQYHRAEFEREAGARWAPEHVARRFAYESGDPNPSSFGVHHVLNWPLLLSRADLAERAKLFADPYIAKTSKSDQLFRAAPWLRQTMGVRA